MARNKPTLEEILASPDERVKILLRFIDEAMESKMARKNIVRAMDQVFGDDEETLRYGKAYLSYKLPDDDDYSSSDYELLCEMHEKPTEYLVQECIKEIEPERGLYVHVDLVIPDIEEEDELRVEVTTLRGTEMIQGWFDKNNIPLYRDGDHLHLKPTLLTDLLGKDYKLDKDEQDQLVMILYKNEKEHYSRKIPIKGPWPSATKPYDSCMKAFKANEDIPEQIAIINERPGWQNFKARMDEMVSRCKVGALRKEAGLTSNTPTLHTIIMGNPGTGKSSMISCSVTLADRYSAGWNWSS